MSNMNAGFRAPRKISPRRAAARTGAGLTRTECNIFPRMCRRRERAFRVIVRKVPLFKRERRDLRPGHLHRPQDIDIAPAPPSLFNIVDRCVVIWFRAP
jgi:hypothetical protein